MSNRLRRKPAAANIPISKINSRILFKEVAIRWKRSIIALRKLSKRIGTQAYLYIGLLLHRVFILTDYINKTEFPFLAGLNEEGEPVFESLEVELLPEDSQRVRLLRSPLLTRNLAAGDTVRIINPKTAEYELERRSGNLSIRVFRKHQLESLAEKLVPEFEKLDGTLDRQTDRAMVLTIHCSIGFQTIEDVLNQACTDYPDTVWYYGNVYDPEDGTTPLNWWLDFEDQD